MDKSQTFAVNMWVSTRYNPGSAAVAKRPRERTPTREIPTVTIRNFSITIGVHLRHDEGLRARRMHLRRARLALRGVQPALHLRLKPTRGFQWVFIGALKTQQGFQSWGP
jgi:hypothetical protein